MSTSPRYPRVHAAWTRLLAQARDFQPGFDATLVFNTAAARPCCRQFAWCEDTSPPRVTVAPKLEAQPAERIEGILRHELGHALDFAGGLSRGIEDAAPERLADAIARRVFGSVIRYDPEDVQTTGPGITPRPLRLGA